jgi:hypothetical protein
MSAAAFAQLSGLSKVIVAPSIVRLIPAELPLCEASTARSYSNRVFHSTSGADANLLSHRPTFSSGRTHRTKRNSPGISGMSVSLLRRSSAARSREVHSAVPPEAMSAWILAPSSAAVMVSALSFRESTVPQSAA